jgi:CRP/FNR family cyclic AMP-dependent transcriptional regulator
MAQIKQIAAGQVLFNEGDPAKCMYLIKSGEVSIRKRKGSTFVEITRLRDGEIIGEISFFDRQPRSATAMALTPAVVTEMPFDSLDAIYAKIPDYLKTIMASIADRIRKTDDAIRRLSKETVENQSSDE